MAKYMVLALNGPTDAEGADETFNHWYDDTHLPELLAVDGIISARRFRVIQSSAEWPYCAAYEIETDNLEETMAAMASGMGEFPPEFDRLNSASVVAMEITPQ